MLKFKVGDKVVVIKNNIGVPEGLEGVIVAVDGGSILPYHVKCNGGTKPYWLMEEEVALVETPKFEVGDKVKVVGCRVGLDDYTGKTGTITCAEPEYNSVTVTFKDQDVGRIFYPEELELVKDPFTFDMHSLEGTVKVLLQFHKPAIRNNETLKSLVEHMKKSCYDCQDAFYDGGHFAMETYGYILHGYPRKDGITKIFASVAHYVFGL